VNGPSPRGWGEPPPPRRDPAEWRTIPTRVGRTRPFAIRVLNETDHPHAGGENSRQYSTGTRLCGPSPRGWGERDEAAQFRHCDRTIPTRVGRTNALLARRVSHPDHPHAGGENCFPPPLPNSPSGPSPRGWGERMHARRRLGVGRTIPTRVGRTSSASRRSGRRSDHPHAGGENAVRRGFVRSACGPSPRGWGEQ